MITILKITALIMVATFIIGMVVAVITKGLGVILSKISDHRNHISK